MNTIDPDKIVGTLKTFAELTGQVKGPRLLPVADPEIARVLMREQGKSIARGLAAQVNDEVDRQRRRLGEVNGRTYYTTIDEAAVFTEDGKAFEYIATPLPPVNYQAVPAGTLLDPSFGPPRAMPLMPNLRPIVMCIRILLMRQGAKLAWY